MYNQRVRACASAGGSRIGFGSVSVYEACCGRARSKPREKDGKEYKEEKKKKREEMSVVSLLTLLKTSET